ncbi:hypothetical protein [Streptomyces sp. NPDC058394]|uniref:hypothetical protein n=1 Tax=Streptomyces sp. NPDC058394 TaxID=3346477 RepID=UPI00365A43CA
MIVFEDEAGQSMRPPKARTWCRLGVTPVVQVPGGGHGKGKVTMARFCCYRPGHRPRSFHALHVYRGRKGETKSFTWRDYRDLLWCIHTHLDAPWLSSGTTRVCICTTK